MTALQTTWFALITVVWATFFVLEGFDFGVGMLVPFLGRDDNERRVLRATTGPFWDGNEVWLIVAVAAAFAAFPDWYATMFSAYYLPFFAVLVALMVRAVGTEYRDKGHSERWRKTWDSLTAASCLLVPFVFGVVFGGLLHGLPINSSHDFTGSFADLVKPYALWSGATFVALCLVQGLLFVRLKTTGDLQARAGTVAGRAAGGLFVVLAVYIVWTVVTAHGDEVIPTPGLWVALTACGAVVWLANGPRHAGLAFACSTVTIAFTVFGFFGTLYPDLMVSTTAAANTITKSDSSSSYTLTLMTIVGVVMLPVIAIYSGWSYWVFRRRVTIAEISAGDTSPTKVIDLTTTPADAPAQ